MTTPGREPLVSVVIPCRGHHAELELCLGSLRGQEDPPCHEIIAVDSAGDPEVQAVVHRHPGVTLVRAREPLLPGPARELGVRHSRGAYLAFIDADCVAERGWLRAALQCLEQGGTLVSGPVLDALPFHPVAVADNLLQFADRPARRPDGPATSLATCNLAVGRAAFDELGGFPRTSLPAGEDILFCEAAAARWPRGLRFCNGMRVRHFGRSGLLAFARHQESFGFCRALLGLRLKPHHRRLGRSAAAMGAVVLKRLAYIARTTARWDPAGLLRVVLVLPLLGVGLVAWAIGFRRGCRAADWRLPREEERE